MSVFYTNIHLYRNDILFRGIDLETGSEVRYREPVKPRLYITSKKNDTHPYYTIDGKTVSPVDFDSSREARDFVKKYDDVSNFNIYGFDNFLYPWINKQFPDEVNYRSGLLRIYHIDIETVSDQGFPDVSIADKEITAITVKDKYRNKFFSFGCQPYKVKSDNVKYYHCRDEHDLLLKFLDFWITEHPNVVTGWNINTFDIPYLVHRIERILGEGWSKKFSPWGIIESRTVVIMGKENTIYDFVGVSILDYLDLYKKFTYSQQESYKLDNIAHVELGERKLNYEDQLTMYSLLSSAESVRIPFNKPNEELDDLGKTCKFRDILRNEIKSRKI